MSLLNDMLRDLDARRSRPADLGALALEGVTPALPRQVPRLPLGRLALGMALAVGLAGAGVHFAAQRAAVTPTPLVTVAVPISDAPAAARPAMMQNEPPTAPPALPERGSLARVPEATASPQATPADAREAAASNAPLHTAPTPPAQNRPVAATPAQPATDVQTRVRTLTVAEQAQQAFEQGAAALRQDQAPRAATLWREALALQPGHAAARVALAGLLARQQRTEEALALLAAGQALAPDTLELARLRGHLLLQQNRLEEARRVLEPAAAEAGQQADYQALLGTLYQRLGQHDLAVAHYRRALALQPDQGLWWMGLGVSLDQTRAAGAAREAYRTALGYGLSPALQDYIRGRLAALANQDG